MFHTGHNSCAVLPPLELRQAPAETGLHVFLKREKQIKCNLISVSNLDHFQLSATRLVWFGTFGLCVI